MQNRHKQTAMSISFFPTEEYLEENVEPLFYQLRSWETAE